MKKVVLLFGLGLFAAPLFAGVSETVSLVEEESESVSLVEEEAGACHAWACHFAELAADNGGDVDDAYETAMSKCKN